METLAAPDTLQIPALQLILLKGGKVHLSPGAPRGIGAAMAHALVDAGASICIAQRDISNTITADSILTKGNRVKIVPCNLRNTEDAKNGFQKALDVMDGKIDILINRSGLIRRKEITLVNGVALELPRSLLPE